MLGDSEYERLLRPLLAQAAAYAQSILRDRHDAEDAVQQAALRGLERLSTYDPARPFKAWWFAILRNGCIDVLRTKRTAKSSALGDWDAPDPASVEVAAWARLSDAIDLLSAEHREILRLRYFGGLSYRDLAAALSIPQGTVMSRLHAARKALAVRVTEDTI